MLTKSSFLILLPLRTDNILLGKVFLFEEVPEFLPAAIVFSLPDVPYPAFNERVYLSSLTLSFLACS
jgi:hypothetical protein